MTSFVLKIIAYITMFIDHIGYGIFSSFSNFNYIGRIAFPIFAFQISEGYSHTKDLKKYFLRLLLFAIISQIPYMMFLSIFTTNFSLNIFFTLLLGLTCIYIYDKSPKKIIGILLCIPIILFSYLIKTDYSIFGVTIILLFYIFKNNKFLMTLSFIISCIIKYLIPITKYGYHNSYLLLCLFTILPIVFINLYNGKQGRKTKYFLYAFYPIHLALIYLFYIFTH